MKKIFIYSSILFFFVLVLFLPKNTLAVEPETWVDDDWAGLPDGTDVGGSRLIGIQAFDDLSEAVTGTSSGGKINVAAGTYYENYLRVTKPLTILGTGKDVTILDGNSATGLSLTGLVRLTGTTGPTTFSGFTVRNAGTDTGGVRVAIYVSSTSATPTITVSDCRIIGSNNPDDYEDYGLYTNSGLENLIFTRNEITGMGANSILIEKHPGLVEISYNDLDVGVWGTDAIFIMTYGNLNITSLQKIDHNNINVGTGGPFDADHRATGVTFASAYRNYGGPDLGDGTFSNIEITNNKITNIQSQRRGIGLWNGDDGDGSGGNIINAKIADNTITGVGPSATGSKGLQLLGLITDAVIQHNQVSDLDYIFHGRLNTVGSTGLLANALISDNSFANANIFQWDGTTTLVAENNWWDACDGPSGVGIGSGVPVSANVDYTPWTGCSVNVSGKKFNDLNNNGLNDSEPGLAGWQIEAKELVETLTINADNSSPVSSSALALGQDYLLEVSGTFAAGDNITADAKYSVRAPNMVWTDSVQNYESYGPELLDLQINGTSPDWGVYASDHTYYLTLTGSGSGLSFLVNDVYYPGNSGKLTVRIFKKLQETVTDENGLYQMTLNNLLGDVLISEKGQPYWSQTYPVSMTYVLETPGSYTDIDFGNHETSGLIEGIKFEDKNGDGERDIDEEDSEENESGLAGWVIILKQGGSEIARATTDEFGVYKFEHLAPGEYQVIEETQTGWVQTYPETPYNLAVNDNTLSNIDFGNYKLGKVSGFKYEDLNGDGRWQSNEPKLANWLIKLSNTVDNRSVYTDANGYYEFLDLQPLSYQLTEKLKLNWQQSEPKTGSYQLSLKSGEELALNFGNYRYASLAGRKYQDLNFNGQREAGEPWLSGWQLELYNLRTGEIKRTITDSLGKYKFSNLVPGPYIIREKLKTGWIPVEPKSSFYRLDLISNQDAIGYHFGNNTVTNYIKFLRNR